MNRPITSHEFFEKIKDVLSLPDNIKTMSINLANNLVLIKTERYMTKEENDELRLVFESYELIEKEKKEIPDISLPWYLQQKWKP